MEEDSAPASPPWGSIPRVISGFGLAAVLVAGAFLIASFQFRDELGIAFCLGAFASALIGSILLLGVAKTARTLEARRLERSLREIRDTMSAILDALPAMVQARDIDGSPLFVNRYARERGLGRTASEVGPEEREAIRTGCSVGPYEETLTDASGHIRRFLTTMVPLPDPDGQVHQVASVGLDVTDRQLAEQALRASEARHRALVDNAPFCILQLGAGDTIESVNPACQAMLGGDDGEPLVGRRFPDLVCADDRAGAVNLVRTARGGTAAHGEFSTHAHGEFNTQAQSQGRILASSFIALGPEGCAATGVMGVLQDVTDARNLAEKLSYQARYDALTGLVNRVEFEQRLRRVLDTARRDGSNHALCYLDLDQFKVINDTCGHVAGDEMLRQVGSLLHGCVRRRDTLARLGGDEFGVLMEHCDQDHAWRVAEQMRRGLDEFRFQWEDKGFNIRVSIGVVQITERSEGLEDVLRAADHACYTAKDRGRNRIHVYRQGDTELSRRHGEMQWVTRIQHALDENRFRLEVQPIVPTRETAPSRQHYEVLLRMVDDAGELIPPGAFLPAAERYDLIGRIDRWVVGTVLDWLSADPARLEDLHLCAVNLSGHSVADDDFLDFVTRKFVDTGVPPEVLCFEITETAAIANLASAMRFIRALRQIGCRFALDDFGSGLSSFAYLKTLPVDFLKIDGVFIRDMVDSPVDMAMVRSINEIGQVMGKETIAEFVEDAQVAEQARSLGIDYCQGYNVGRPRPLEGLT